MRATTFTSRTPLNLCDTLFGDTVLHFLHSALWTAERTTTKVMTSFSKAVWLVGWFDDYVHFREKGA